MPLFRRRSFPAPTAAARSRSGPPPSGEDPDWRAYDSIAPDYARVMAPRMELPAADLASWLGIRPGWRVLDVGTGTGVAARAALTAAGGRATVVGVDRSVPMLDLPFRDSTFDAVAGNFVLSHFTKVETALFDMLRVLRPGGRMGFTAWGPGNDAFSGAWQEVAEGFAEREIIADARTRAIPWDELFSDLGRLKMTLHDAGLRDIRAERREYRLQMSAEDYLTSREITAAGRFLREMLGSELWERFRQRSRQVFADRFPATFNDFRDVNLAVGAKPETP